MYVICIIYIIYIILYIYIYIYNIYIYIYQKKGKKENTKGNNILQKQYNTKLETVVKLSVPICFTTATKQCSNIMFFSVFSKADNNITHTFMSDL